MKKVTCLSMLIIFWQLYSFDIIAQNWSSIIPLKSTRIEVEKILGVCEEKNPLSCLYKMEKQNIFFIYNTLNRCEDGVFNVPKGTVITMSIYPKNDLRISELNFNMKNFVEEKDPEIFGVKQYVNDNEGITIEAIDEYVIGIYYGSSKENRELYKCKNVK